MKNKTLSQKRAEAGKIGGTCTREKYGSDHYRKIGKLGAKTTWSRYGLKPVGQSGWAMVNRESNEVKTFVNYIPATR